MDKENLPLIPDSSVQENHDTQTILRDIFQEILEMPKYPENIAKNISKYNVECEYMKSSAQNVEKIIERSLLSMEDIAITEEKLMYKQANYLTHKFSKKDDVSTKQARMSNGHSFYRSKENCDASKYELLRSDNLLPSGAMKPTVQNVHTCDSCRSDLDFTPTKLSKRKVRLKYALPSEQPVPACRLDTNTVVFCNYKLNVSYEKQFKLQNISKSPQCFYIESLPQTKYFTVEQLNIGKTGSGLYTTFLVTFRTDSFLDLQDYCVIISRSDLAKVTLKLVSYRNAPNLYMYVFKNLLPMNYGSSTFEVSRSIALNNSIDCGACFIGQSIQIYLIVRNEGGTGKFFFIRDEDWNEYTIKNLYESLEAKVGRFTIFPAYFEIGEHECIVIKVEFTPTECGVNLEIVRLLCNNITYECLDILADGVIFDKYCITFHGTELLSTKFLEYIVCPPRLVSAFSLSAEDVAKSLQLLPDKTKLASNISAEDFMTGNEPPYNTPTETVYDYLYTITVDDNNDEESCSVKICHQFLIYCGKCVPYRTIKKKITVNNNCLLDLKYYWKIEDQGSDEIGFDKLKNLNKSCIEVFETYNSYLPAYSTTDLDISITPNVIDIGFYRLVLKLYIESIPVSAVTDLNDFIYEEKPDKLINVLLATFDVLCMIDSVEIIIKPEEIFADHDLEYNETFREKFYVKVLNEDKELMNCHWLISNPNISIIPNNFSMREGENIPFVITLINNSYSNISETVQFVVNDLYRKDFKIEAKVCLPILKLSHAALHFGYLEIGNTYYRKLCIINDNCTSVEWELNEIITSDLKENNVELMIKNSKNGINEMEYKIDANDKINWSSELVLYSIHNGEKIADASCRITFIIDEIDVCLHTMMSESAILCPSEILFLNAKKSYQLCLHNFSNMRTVYRFDKPFGNKANLINVQVKPNFGCLLPNTATRVDIEITPLVAGNIDEVYVPCNFENVSPFLKGDYKPPEPAVLVILCSVEDICVKIVLPPNRNGTEEVINWPAPMIYEFDNDELDATEFESANESSYYSPVAEIGAQNNILNEDLSRYFKFVEICKDEEEDLHVTKNTSTLSSQTDISTLSSESDLKKLSTESLQNNFPKDFVKQQNIIEFHNVPLRTAVSQKILIENVSPIRGTVTTEILNYSPVGVPTRKLDKILAKMNMNMFDDYFLMLPPEGIFIKAEPRKKELKPFETEHIDILVYAATWGVYADELTIKINNIIPFCVTLLVEVVGLPIEFPIGTTYNRNYPIFRFGMIPYKSEQVSRKVYVRNTSFIPLCITWHIYMKSKPKSAQPFTLIFDLCHQNLELTHREQHNSLGNLIVTYGKYCGKSETLIFQLNPKETCIQARQTTSIDIFFNPEAYASSFDNTDVEAYLIGYIQLPLEYKYQANLVSRKTGSDMEHLKMKLMISLELPQLKLELVTGDLRFVTYATEAVEASQSNQSKILCFKNLHDMDVAISMYIDDPFKVVQMKTKNLTTTDEYKYIGIEPNECVEVEILYTFNVSEMLEIADTLYGENYESLYSDRIDYSNYLYKYTSRLNIAQKGFMQQYFVFDIVIYFPHIEITQEVDFGEVYIGNVQKKIITIRNFSGFEVPFSLETTGELIISPKFGKLQGSKKNIPGYMDVSVIFIPRLYKVYNETIILKTNIPQYEKQVFLTGAGSYDEKFFKHDVF